MNTAGSSFLALRISAVMVCAALAACTHRPPISASSNASTTPAVAAQPAASGDVRERMRAITKVHCGSCHQSTLPTAKPAALAIYDLDSPEWPTTLSRARLEGGFTRRLNAVLDEESKSLLRAFVAAEAAKR